MCDKDLCEDQVEDSPFFAADAPGKQLSLPILKEPQFLEDNPTLASQHKQQGNHHFKLSQYDQAIECYHLALQYTGEPSLITTVYSNLAILYLKQERFKLAAANCLKALQKTPEHVKALTNLAISYEKLGKDQEALTTYQKVKALAATPLIESKIKELQAKVDQLNEKRKEEALTGLKSIGNSLLGYFGMSLDNFQVQQGPNGGYNINFKQ